MKNRMRVLVFSLLTWMYGFSLQAQTELNVKINSDHSSLISFFKTHQNPQLLSVERNNLKTAYPFIEKVQAVRALTNAAEPTAVSQIFTLKFDSQNEYELLQSLLQTGVFEFAEPNNTVKVDAVKEIPNDDSLNVQWHHPLINTFAAWDITKGSASVKIGVIDTGLDYNHPEYTGQLYINMPEDRNQNGTFEPWDKDEIRDGKSGDFDGTDQDGNGYEDDVIGYDFTDTPRAPKAGDYLFPDADPQDEQFHGTFVSGIISARENNQIGGAGIAPGCKLLTLKAFGSDGSGEDDDIARAIVYAAENNVNVLNLSFGDAYPSMIMREAIRYANSKGVIIVASAGNGTGDDLHYPSGFDEVISVSATTENDGDEYLWQLSSYGWTVALAAPGSGIFSTTLRDTVEGVWTEYITASGTSASAPMVSAAAALLLSQRPFLSPQHVRGILCNGADDIMNAGWDHYTGAGRLNILQSLKTVGSTNVQIHSPGNDEGSNQDEVYITGTVLEPEMKQYSLEYQQGTEGEGDWITITENQNFQVAGDTLVKWNLTGLAEGDYTLRLKVEKTNGFTVEDRVRFVRDKSAPEISINAASPILDNQERKYFIAFRSSDRGLHTLYFRKAGAVQYQQLKADKYTRSGEFLIGKPLIEAGNYEYYIATVNEAGLLGQSTLMSFQHEPELIEMSGIKQLKYSLPMGGFLPDPTDFDGDGLKEAVLSVYDDRLSYGKIHFYEYSLSGFVDTDSLTFKNILIPKSLSDSDNDGLLDLLCSVNDTSYIVSQSGANSFPAQVTWTQNGGGKYASRFADLNNDGTDELLMKDFKDYYALKRNGNQFNLWAELADNTPDYEGSIAPRALVWDFDGDGKKEIVFGDYDGDFVIYEFNGIDGFAQVYADSLEWLFKSGEYLAQGDFDGDGQQEFFVATHPLPGLRNADNEYDPLVTHLRIFKSTADNTWEKVWEDYLYDIDTDQYNAATAGNIDSDAADELIFTTFPRTYLLEYKDGKYQFTWFYYGSLATHHIIGDFNNNGVAEFGVGRGDSTLMFEKDFLYTGPQQVTTLEGIVSGPDKTHLTWQQVPDAASYDIYRQEYGTGGNAVKIGNTTQAFFTDNTVTSNQWYLYGILSVNPVLTPSESGFSNIVALRPHPKNRIDSVKVIISNQLQVFFSEKMTDRPEDIPFFVLDGQNAPVSIAATNGNTLVLAFNQDFENGQHVLRIDTALLDMDSGRLNPADTVQTFVFLQEDDRTVYLTHWEVSNEKQGVLYFNLPMKPEVLDVNHYQVFPFGEIEKLEWEGIDGKGVRFTLTEPVLGPVGYSLSVTVTGVSATDNTAIREGEGNTATFSKNAVDMSGIYVYPNPKVISANTMYEGIYFAGLPQTAQITIYTLSGRKVNVIEETDGNGGVHWDLKDETGSRIPSGVYLYKAESGSGSFTGKFSVVD